jgi:hypothetical protein
MEETTQELGKNHLEKLEEKGVVVHDCNPSYLVGKGRRIKRVRPAQAKLSTTC